ncbi:MAG: hypothetical protein ABI693_23755, partial [Bryobacteraceae bacterium]
WFGHLDAAIAQLEALPFPFVDRAALELALGVGRRRAQQILQPLVRHSIGRNGLADRDELIAHLRQIAAGDVAFYENRRRQRLSAVVEEWHRQAHLQPRVLVEAPAAVVNQEVETLPPGVYLAPGRIVLEDFSSPEEAKQKLLALIIAIGNNPDEFDARIS